MRLPENIKNRPFSEWNELVKGVVQAWELARVFQCEEELERFLTSDAHGNAVEFIACLMNGKQRQSELERQ